jgi:adenylate cyclase
MVRTVAAQRAALQELHASLTKQGVAGAEIELSLLFADIRDSTSLGEKLRPAEFSAIPFRVLSSRGGGYRGERWRCRQVRRRRGDRVVHPGILRGRSCSHSYRRGPRGPGGRGPEGRITKRAYPGGGGVHTGIAYVGSLGSSEQISDFTALGDSVNTTARLGLDPTDLERRTVDVRGREVGLDVYTVRADTKATA